MRHPGQRRLSSDQTRTRSLLIGDIDGERLGLVGQQRLNGRATVAILLAAQDRRTLTFDIAEIGPMLGITDQLSAFGIEVPRDTRRIAAHLVPERRLRAEAIAGKRLVGGKSV